MGGPLDGPGRAWRVTVDRTKVGHPRFSPDGRHIAYTSWRSIAPEIHLAPVDGGPGRRLTYWGSADTQVCGWSPDGDILAVASHGQPFSYFTWAYSVPTNGDPGGKLPWGPVSDIAVADIGGERQTLLLTGTPPHEPAAWKRYRGGATGRLWLHGRRLLPDLEGHLDTPMFVDGRIAFLSDHEGVGNLYSCAYDGSDLRRHTDHDAYYARHASGDGTRVVYQCAGDLWIVDDLSPTRSRAVSTSGSAGRARDAVPTRCRPPSTSTASPWTRRAGPAPSSYGAACTGSPTATAPRGPSRTPPAYGSGSPRCSAPAARSPTSPTRRARTPSRSPTSRARAVNANRAAWPPANWAAYRNWCRTRRASASRSRRTTGGCCSWTRPRSPTVRSPSSSGPSTGRCAISSSRRTGPG